MSYMNRKFGVEIEALGLTKRAVVAALTRIGYRCEIQEYNHITYESWKVVPDSSISGENTFELVSPPLRGQNGLDQVAAVMNALVAAGARINASCGFHVHVDAADVNGDIAKKLVKRYARWEEIIDSIMPTSRRGNNNEYCRSNKHAYEQTIMEVDSNDIMRIADRVRSARRFKLNIASYLRHRTIEFRQHSGTLNAEKAINWIKFCLNFIHTTINPIVVSETNTVSASGVRLTRKHNLIRELVSRQNNDHNGATMSELVEATNLSETTIKAYISTLRTACNLNILYRRWEQRFVLRSGLPRRRRRNGRLPSRTVASTPTLNNVAINSNNSDNPFKGLDTLVTSYYNERRAEFNNL